MIITTVTLCQTVVLNTLVVAQTVWKRTLEISWLTTRLKYVLAKFKFPRVHSGFQTEPFTTASACSQFVVKHSLSNYIFFSVKFSFRELNEQNVD